jgi:hypothetical protein
MGYEMTEKYDGPWQDSLSEETRQMINDASFKAWQKFFDELTYKPAHITKEQRDRVELGKRIRLIAVDLELSGQDGDARVLMMAADKLMQG